MQVGDLVLVYETKYRPMSMGIVTAINGHLPAGESKKFVFVRLTDSGLGNWYHPHRVKYYASR